VGALTDDQNAAQQEAARQAVKRLWNGRRGPDWARDMVDRVDVLILATYETHSLQEQVDLMERTITYSHMSTRRRRLIRSGHLDNTKRAKSARISSVQRREILRLYDEGWSPTSIAAILTCTPNRARRVIEDRGTGRNTAPGKTYLLTDLARAFGGMDSLLRNAVREGWLSGGHVGPNLRHNYSLADVIDFLRVREAWVFYEPRHIINPDIRQAAELARRATPGRWVSVSELHVSLDLPRTTIVDLFCDGRFAGYETAKILHGHFLWLPAGWDLPIIRRSQRRGVPHEIISRSHATARQHSHGA
jgi:hypothetical protein